VETSAREPHISTRPLAVAKCWAWLMSKEFHVCQAPSVVILKSVIVSHPTLPLSPDKPAHKKNSGYKKNPVLNNMGSLNKRAGKSASQVV
jgi:hypothetical protein